MISLRKLRFPNYLNDWEEKTIEETVTNIGGTSLERFVDSISEYRFISIGNYSTRGKYIDNGQRLPKNSVTAAKILNRNDLVMVLNDKTARGELIGSTILIDEDNMYIYNQRSERLICKKGFSPIFLWYLLNSSGFRKRIAEMAQGATQIYINFKDVKKQRINLPTLEEQKKIASFLSSVDSWIENLRKQKELLEKYKKKILNVIFTKNSNSWNKAHLSSLAEIIMGQSPDSRYSNSDGHGFHLVQGNADIDNRKVIHRTWTTMITKHAKKGNIIMTVRAPVGYVAKLSSDVVIGRGVCAISPKKIESDYLYQYLIFFEDKWLKLSQGTTFDAVNSKDIQNLLVPVPPIDEQKKIADFLSSIDNLIETKQKQISMAEKWKKGLMQQMFI